MAEPEVVRKGKLLEKYAEAVTQEIRDSLRDAVPGLSTDNFSELAKFHKSIDWSNIGQQCHEKIKKKLEHQFDETWDDFGMKTKIGILELLKKRTKNKDIQQWRPYGKTPSEQCRPYIMEILNGKNYFLHQYLQNQQAKLVEDLVPAIDEYRARIQRINEKRDRLHSQMDRSEEMNKHNQETFDELEQKLKILTQLNRLGGCGQGDDGGQRLEIPPPIEDVKGLELN